jgi:UDP-GlcNAc:undecaprenyl-phosphate/decaprenyl-phosphate GlcNAc-1-phosphate transferase
MVLLTGALAAGFTWLQVRLSRTARLTAAPREDRWHRVPTPSSGGIAIFVTLAFAYAAWFPGRHVPIVMGAAGLWLLGLLDDLFRLPPWAKLLGQVAASALVIASGVVFHATPWPAFNIAFSFLWLVGITNAFNLIDNMDGLSAGVVTIIGTFRFLLLANSGDWADANLCAVIAAAYAGFLLLNRNPARIFMGDCGSMLAGFSLAALTIASPLAHTKAFVAGVFYPALTFTYPIFDTMLVSVLRKAAGRPISVGGRDHSSHRLVSTGLTESRAVAILWGLTAGGSAVGLLVHSMPMVFLFAGSFLVVVFAVFGIFLATLPAYPLPVSVVGGNAWIRRRIPSLRAGVVVVLDATVAGLALLFAFFVRFGVDVAPDQLRNFTLALPVMMATHAAFSCFRRTYALSWRYFSLADAWPLLQTAVLAAACGFLGIWMLNLRSLSRGVMVLYVVFCVAGLLLLRSSVPVLRVLLARPPERPSATVLPPEPATVSGAD